MKQKLQFLKRWTVRFLAFFVGSILLYFVFAFILGIISTNPSINTKNQNITIFVRSNGMHTDLILPAEYSPIPLQTFEAENAYAQEAKYVAFGWGDKGFYLEVPTLDKLKFSIVFDALFFRGTTLMHVGFYPFIPKESETCKKLKINQQQLKNLQNHIAKSFQKNDKNQLQILKGKGYGKRDEFYEAIGTYSFLNTCNVWTNTGLKKMDCKTAIWSPFDTAILWHLE